MKFNLVKFKPKQLKGLKCLNCEQSFTGHENFCSYCGQKNSVKKLSFNHFLSNLFAGFFSYDSRFWRTFIPLLTKPGKVSKDYIKGKRVRFVNPFQLYLNVSIIFFLLLGLFNKIDDKQLQENLITINNGLDSIGEQNKQQLDSVYSDLKKDVLDKIQNDSAKAQIVTGLDKILQLSDNKTPKTKKQFNYAIRSDSEKNIGLFKKIRDFQHFHDSFPKYSNEQALDSLGYKKTFWNKLYYQQVINTIANFKQSKTKEGINKLINKITSYISISLFVFLPVFTLFLWLIYVRRKITYMEHLVFVFHTQTVFFLLLALFLLLNLFANMQYMWMIFILLFLIYLYKALRNFYQQNRLKTIVKFFLLNNFYLLLATIGFIIVTAISFMVK